jgi:SAM-dependent methyltransferase
MANAPEMNPSSINYYETHAQTFFADTVALDMAPLYARFLERLPPGGSILDAGCGSGRDTRAFLERGYAVTAFDASPTLAQLASAYCGLPVAVLRVQDMAWEARFDGIWACASLLHVPLWELPEVLRRLATALKPGGILYASFKYGRGEREQGGRRFTDLDEAGLAALLHAAPYFTMLETWITADQRPERAAERWLNSLLPTTIVDR